MQAPLSDSNLINGRNNYDCSQKVANDTTPCRSNAGISNFRFTPGKVHRLRLINSGAEGVQKFSVDGHVMTVIANDFVPVVPYETKGKQATNVQSYLNNTNSPIVVTLGIGQRTDVLITGLPSNATCAYLMRSSIAAAPCSGTLNPDATAIVYYKHDALKQGPPNSTVWPEFTDSVQNICRNDDLNVTKPWFTIKPDLAPPTTETVDITFGQNSTGFWTWKMNNSSFRANFNQPVFLLAATGSEDFPDHPEWNVHNFGSNSSIRIVINNNGPPIPHPIHLHGHNFFVIDEGVGTWDGKTVRRGENPQRRDVQILQAGGYLVLQVTADNPGAWPLHCHIVSFAFIFLLILVATCERALEQLIKEYKANVQKFRHGTFQQDYTSQFLNDQKISRKFKFHQSWLRLVGIGQLLPAQQSLIRLILVSRDVAFVLRLH